MCKCKKDKCIDCGNYYFPVEKQNDTKMNILIFIFGILMFIAAISLTLQTFDCEEVGGVFVGAMFDSQCVGVEK